MLTLTYLRRFVCLKQKDPLYLTPFINLLLTRRNGLRRKGRLDEANALANKVNRLISDNRKTMLSNVSQSDPGKLWALLRKSNNWGTKTSKLNTWADLDDINKSFADIATDQHYCNDVICDKLQKHVSDVDFVTSFVASYTTFEISVRLFKLRKTSTGSEGIPFWVLKESATELGGVLVKLINFSI